MVVEDEDAQLGAALRELLLDPGVAATTYLAVVEVGLSRVDRHDRHSFSLDDVVPRPEQLLEVDVPDVAGVVVAGDHDHRVALEPVEVRLRLKVLVLEPHRRQVSRADDDVRPHVVDLVDRPLHQPWNEVRLAAVDVRDVGDPHDRKCYAFSARASPRHPGPLLRSRKWGPSQPGACGLRASRTTPSANAPVCSTFTAFVGSTSRTPSPSRRPRMGVSPRPSPRTSTSPSRTSTSRSR